MKNFYFFLFIICFTISCNEKAIIQEEKDFEKNITGFWQRKGTIQIVNGVSVDTLFLEDFPNPNFKQMKAFKNGSVVWINNSADTLYSWKGSSGAYSTYERKPDNLMFEIITSGTGGIGGLLKTFRDSLKIYKQEKLTLKNALPLIYDKSLPYPNVLYYFKANEKSYVQGTTMDGYQEYWRKMKPLSPSGKMDGIWKRAFEIRYVNNIPVDTISIPNDQIMDVKIMLNGRYIYQVDLTEISDPDTPEFGGYGAYGTFEYDDEKNKLKEYQEFGSGGNVETYQPKTNEDTHKITFYNDDMFLQLSKNLTNAEKIDMSESRGVIYKRIKL